MRKILTLLVAATLVVGVAGNVDAQLISEFEPNPAGTDPADTTFELSGTPSAMFGFYILSIENDGIDGNVDRSANVSGTFDANGLAVVTVPDLENPSFTVVLSENAIAIGTDLDADDDGAIDDVSLFGTVFDSVGVSDAAGDDATLYSTGLGGSSILFNGAFEPLNVFRDASTGQFFQTVTVDFGLPTQRVAIFPAGGGAEVSASLFTGGDPLATTFGAINPSFAVPEPSSMALLGLIGLAGLVRRRR